MNTTTRIAAAAIALFAASTGFAAEGTQDFPVPAYQSSTTRAAVVAKINDGSAPQYIGEASAAPVAVSTLPRARVVAEAREALRLGLIGPSETVVQPTAKQLEQIRVAGDRAVAPNVAAAR